MSFTTPVTDPTIFTGPVGQADQTDPTALFTTDSYVGAPLYRRLPSNVAAYQKLDAELNQLAQTGLPQEDGSTLALDPSTLAALRTLAQQRITRGQLPPGPKDAPTLLRAGQSLQAQYPMPERGTSPLNIVGNFASDIRDIFTSIPKLPYLLYQQVKELPSAPGQLAAALGKGDFQAASRVPGVNLIPGVYTLGNILEGDFGELARHPGFTTLDLMPLAEAKVFAPASAETLASRARLPQPGRLLNPAEAAALPLAAAETGRPTIQAMIDLQEQFGGRPNRSLLQVIGDETPVGRIKDSMTARARASKVGQYVNSRLTEPARNIARLGTHYEGEVRDLLNPRSPLWNPDDPRYLLSPRNIHHWAAEDAPAIQQMQDFMRRYVTNDGIAETSGGRFTNVDQWEPRRREITEAIQHESLPDAAQRLQMEPWEVQMVNDAQAVTETIVKPYTADYALDAADNHKFAWVDTAGSREMYPIAQARKIEQARLNARIAAEYRDAANATDASGLLDPERVSFLRNKHVPTQARLDVLSGHLWNLRNAGVDVQPILRQLGSSGLDADLFSALNTELAKPPLYTLEDIANSYIKRGPSGRRVKLVPESLRTFDALFQRGLYRDAWNELDRYFNRTQRYSDLPESLRSLDMERVKDTLREYDDHKTVLARLDKQASAADRLAKRADTVAGYYAPARYFPNVRDRAMVRMESFARALGHSLDTDGALADQLAEFVRADQLEKLGPHLREAERQGVTRAELIDPTTSEAIFPRARPDTLLTPSVDSLFRGFAREATNTWREMKLDGLDPQFVHAVSDERGLNLGRIQPSPKTVNQAKARTFDFAPTSGDLAIAMNHQMTEWLVQKQTDRFINAMANGDAQLATAPFTATMEELSAAFEPVAKARAQRYGTTVSEETAKLIDGQFARFEPNQYLNFPKPVARSATDTLFIDKSLLGTINQMASPVKVSALWDPVMGVFRTSVLTLSPRWQIYNVLGNAVQITLGHGVDWLKYAGEAREILRYMSNPEGVPPAALAKLNEGMRLSLSQLPREAAEFQFRAGAATAQAFKGEVPGALAAASKGFHTLTDKLTKMNGWVDDAYRLMSYLDAYDKAYAKYGGTMRDIRAAGGGAGITPIQAAAEAQVRKIMYSWDSMTPFERQTMRYIFPFYGFMSHVGRFAYRYAIDHPVRLAWTAAFARAEIEDWQSGLPERLRSMLIYNTDDKNKAKAINLAGWNPFGDVASFMTLTGWLSQVNPVVSTLAEQFGIDPRTGQANIYPESEYDPQTGRLVLKTRNPAIAFLENMIPQSQALTSAVGLNPEMDSLRRSDPAATNRLLLSSFGIPNLTREIDLPLEAMKAEGVRDNAFSQAMGNVFTDPGTSTQYPVLNSLRDQILQLQASNPSSLRRYTPAGIADIQQNVVATLGP